MRFASDNNAQKCRSGEVHGSDSLLYHALGAISGEEAGSKEFVICFALDLNSHRPTAPHAPEHEA